MAVERTTDEEIHDGDVYAGRRSVGRWVPACSDPAAAGATQGSAVQLERDDGGPARRRQADNLGAVVGPAEVDMPVLGAGIDRLPHARALPGG